MTWRKSLCKLLEVHFATHDPTTSTARATTSDRVSPAPYANDDEKRAQRVH
jgi:hypothetical protein